jgi:hypothetical protein
LPNDCHNQAPTLIQGKTILIPVYNTQGGQGANGWYGITGWAAFQVEGYAFTGGTNWNAEKVQQNCQGTCFGLYGRFVQFASLDSSFTVGAPSSYGVTIVKLME